MRRPDGGFTLLELMLAMALGTIVLTALVALTLSINRALAVQQALGGLQSQARYAETQLARRAAAAGYQPQPWNGPALAPVSGSREGGVSDVLVLRAQSPQNCLGNRNPVRAPDGTPAYFLRVSEWRLGTDQRLVETCHYGPPGAPGTRQLNASTRVEGVETFQALFAEDLDGDGRADRWVRAGEWLDEHSLLGVRVGLLLASRLRPGAPASGPLHVLDQRITPPDDGRARLLLERTIAFEGRQR